MTIIIKIHKKMKKYNIIFKKIIIIKNNKLILIYLKISILIDKNYKYEKYIYV